ncbi:MAG TPA: DUF3237 domain-containing protein [Burkholderiales bacterium]|nr:DUF3237 domain-containing protein [Burkholderiales bacterium]
MPHSPAMPELNLLARIALRLAPPLDLGQGPLGRGKLVGIAGGTVSGGRLRGEVLPGGSDWQTVREDGSLLVEARYVIRTLDGALVTVRENGVRHGPPEILARVAAGEAVDPSTYYFRTTPRFETGDERVSWLNNAVCVGSSVRVGDSVLLDCYVVD